MSKRQAKTIKGAQWRNRKVETKRMRVGDVLPHPMNPKIHGENQLAPLRGLLENVGKLDDLKAYYSERNGGKLTYFDGHGRMSLDPSEEWDIDIYDLTDAEADIAVATFDPIAYQAQMSRERLDHLLREVTPESEALQKLLADVAEKEGLYLDSPSAGSGEPSDAEPQIDKAKELNEKWKVKAGDLWLIGEHRLLCGDSTKAEDVARVMNGEKTVLCLTDPPYGIALNSEWQNDVHRKEGKALNHNAQSIANDCGEISFELFQQWPRRIVFGFPYLADMTAKGWLVWDKEPGFEGRSLTSPVEMAYSTTWEGFRAVRLLWSGYMREAGSEDKVGHPTQKPLKLMMGILEAHEDKAIVDQFCGSGTTMVAAQNLNRKCYALEISPEYCAVILERMKAAFPSLEIRREAKG